MPKRAAIHHFHAGLPGEATKAYGHVPASATQESHTVSKVYPFHSKKPGTEVHHNNNQCVDGNNIETYNKSPGTGGHPLCHRCKNLA